MKLITDRDRIRTIPPGSMLLSAMFCRLCLSVTVRFSGKIRVFSRNIRVISVTCKLEISWHESKVFVRIPCLWFEETVGVCPGTRGPDPRLDPNRTSRPVKPLLPVQLLSTAHQIEICQNFTHFSHFSLAMSGFVIFA